VLWVARDAVMSYALGVFTATFLYAITALVGVDRGGSGRVPLISTVVVAVLLLASVGMFIALIQRIGLLQINRMPLFTGDLDSRAFLIFSSKRGSIKKRRLRYLGPSSAHKCFAKGARQAVAASNCQFLGRITSSMACTIPFVATISALVPG